MRRILQITVHTLLIMLAAFLYGQKPARQQHITTFGGSKAALVSQVASDKSGEVAFEINLGAVHALKLKPVAGLPQFSLLDWNGLSNENLPSGATITTVAEEGKPEIPYLVLTIAIPSGAKNFEPFVNKENSVTLTDILFPPRPYRINDSISELRYDEKRYETHVSASADLGSPARFRSLRMIALRVPLAEFDAKSGKASALTKFRCGIRFIQPESKGSASRYQADPYMSTLYRSAVANTSDIERFSVPLRQRRQTQSTQGFSGKRTFDGSVTGWIDTASAYIKLVVTRTGLYRVTATELAASGINAANWNANEVRLFNKGKEVPVWVDVSGGKLTAIEFYGERLPGFPGEYYNVSSDSNAYWLTNSTIYSGAPKRFAPRAIEDEPPVVVNEGQVKLHHERDYLYHGGDKVADESTTTHRTDWIHGERFVWRLLRKPHEVNGNWVIFDIADSFYVTKLPTTTTGRTARSQIFLHGISKEFVDKSTIHKCSVQVNGTTVTTVEFKDFNDTLHTFDVPLDLVNEGRNSVAISFINTDEQKIDQWYCDYYSLELPIGLAPSTDTAIASGQWDFDANASGDLSRLALITSTEPHVYNLTDGVRLVSHTASGNTFHFRDSLGEVPKHYVGATPPSFLKPSRISSWSGWKNILDTLQGADYIVITHPEFTEASNILAAKREAAGLRAKVVTTDEINNAFNYGSDEPEAIKRFLHYAFDFYAGTPPTFVTLMGDATWDPKFNLNNPVEAPENRTIHRNYVHSYGVPSSDAAFTMLERGDSVLDSLNLDMVIARLPVESKEEAEHFLSKLEEYESRPPEEWNRHMLFSIGGTYPAENDNFRAYLGQFFDQDDWGGVRNSPLGINTTVISRTDFSDNIDKTHVAELQSEFREGKSLVYFFGHGATFITDVFFSDPGLYRNKGLYPVFITLSCRTGAFAEANQITLNEAFLRQPDGGVVMAYGTTGYGEVIYDRRLTVNIFNILRADSSVIRQPASGPHQSNISGVFTLAKFIASVIETVGGTLSDSWYNSLLQYSVLGDAAMGFALRPQPEFNVSANEVTLADNRGQVKNVFSVSDSFVTVTAKVHNFGRVAENEVHVSFTNVQPKKEIVIIDTLVRLDSSETIRVSIPLDTFAVGANQLRVKIDNDELFAETEENDNEAVLTFQVSGFSATPFFPPDGAKNFCDASASDSVRFVLILPSPSAVSGVPSVRIEVDTTVAFTSPASLGVFNVSGAFFERSVHRSLLPQSSSGVIWWRTRLTVGGDSGSWSVSSVNINSNGTPSFSYSTGDQLERTIVSGLHRDTDGAIFIPSNDTLIWDLIAHGHHDTNATLNAISQILANGRPLKIFSKNGFLVAPLTADSANLSDTLYEFLNISTGSDSTDRERGTSLAKSFDSVIALIPEGRRVIVLGNFQPVIPYFTHTQTVKNAMKSLGSANGFDGLQYFGSYILFGTKGAPSGSAKEKFGGDGSGGVEIFDTSIVAGSAGIARTPSVFVANSFGRLYWQATDLAKDSSLILHVLGEPRLGGLPVVLKSIFARGIASTDLSDIDAREYPRLAVEMRFLRPNDVVVSPRLYSIEYEYDPAPEFVIEESSLTVDPGEVEEGLSAVSSYSVRNLLCIDGVNVPLALARTYQGANDTIATPLITQFNGRTTASFIDTISTLGYQGRVGLTAVVNPGGEINEQLLFNNTSSAAFDVRRDSSKPVLDVLFDDARISNGEYVSSKVRIAMRLLDDSPVRVKDSSAVIGELNYYVDDALISHVKFDAQIPLTDYNLQLNLPATGSLQAELVVTSKTLLQKGNYVLTVFGFDGSGNGTDTLEFEFVVSDKQGIEHVMNYPNPFTDLTAFTFVLRSGMSSNINIYIYTTSGRRIRTLSLDADKQKPGINSIEWDGRDDDGNDVANGTYLYKVVVAGKNEDGSDANDAVFEKAVRSR